MRIDAPEKLVEVMRALKVGTTACMTVFQNGEYREVEYELPERPLLPGDISGRRSLGPAAEALCRPCVEAR